MPLDIGSSIRVLRLAKGLQLKEVAAAAAISNPFLTLVEKGDRNPSLAVTRRIADALGVPVEALILISQPTDTTMHTSNDYAERIVASVKRLAQAEENLRQQLEIKGHDADAICRSDP